MHVALSRVKSLGQLYIIGEIDPKHIRADPRVHKEYERLRSRDLQACIPDIMTSCAAANDTILFTLLNVRSLRKHCTDLKFDLGIICCDVLALTETRLKPSRTNEFIKEHLDAFRIKRQDNDNDFFKLGFLHLYHCRTFQTPFLSRNKWSSCNNSKRPNFSQCIIDLQAKKFIQNPVSNES